MDDDDVRRIIDSAQVKLELRLSEQLRSTEQQFAARIRALESKLQTIQQTAAVIIAVAIIFGLGGAWGAWFIRKANSEISTLNNEVTKIKPNVDALKKQTQDSIALLNTQKNKDLREFRKKLSTQEHETSKNIKNSILLVQRQEQDYLISFRKELNKETTKEFSNMQGKFEKNFVFSTIRAKSIEILSEDGKKVISLQKNGPGGAIQIFNAFGASVVSMGALNYEAGDLIIRDSEGKKSLEASGYAPGGDWYAYNSATGKMIATLGSIAGGDGGIWIANSDGEKLLEGIATGASGSWQVHR